MSEYMNDLWMNEWIMNKWKVLNNEHRDMQSILHIVHIIPKILNLKSQLFMSLNIRYGEETIYVNYFL